MKFGEKKIITLPDSQQSWIHSHMAIPTPILLGDKIRVYVNFFDLNRKSRVGYIDLDINNPEKIIAYSEKPVLDIGQEGCFDQDGVLQCSVIQESDGTLLMYYVGFELGTKIRYRLLTGLAISKDGGESFERYQSCPILERSESELYFRGGPFVIKEENKYRLWYVAGSDWININNKAMPVYSIKYLESSSPYSWASSGEACIDVESSREYCFGRPYYFSHENKHYLFYSIRDREDNYLIGYAESKNSYDWIRKDIEIGLHKSDNGFDSEMICYAAPIFVNGEVLLFFNGNDFGREGIAYAKLESFN